MAEQILQINFQFQSMPALYARAVESIADAINAVPGLRRMLWLLNAERHESGGICEFADEDSVPAFLDSPLMLGLQKHPLLYQVSLKQFAIVDPSDLSPP